MSSEQPDAAATGSPIHSNTSDVEIDDTGRFEGRVDFFGYHPTAQGWLFVGWVTHPWPVGDRPEGVVACFADGSVAEYTHSTFYSRADVVGRGIGYVFFLHAASQRAGPFEHLEVHFASKIHKVPSAEVASALSEEELNRHLQPILAAGEPGSERRKLLDLMMRGSSTAKLAGLLEFYGYIDTAGGWLIGGWIGAEFSRGQLPTHITASFERGDIDGDAVVVTNSRADLPLDAEGAVFLVQAGNEMLGSLCWISFAVGAVRTTVHAGPSMRRLREQELMALARPYLGEGTPERDRDLLVRLLSRGRYCGQDTIEALTDPVFLFIDEAILCGPDGLVLMGWHLAAPGVVQAIRVCCGDLRTPLDLEHAVTLPRPDVTTTLTVQHGFDDPRCGFIAFIPQSVVPGERIYLEVETYRREFGFRGAPRPKLQGMMAIRRILEPLNVRFGEVQRAFDNAIGPAIESLNRDRLISRPAIENIAYGSNVVDPKFTLIIPLYGRIDFVEYQIALLSARDDCAGLEIIYVLDDPPQRQAAQLLCDSVHERFRVPFRLLLLDRNVGFAPASNIGLDQASGDYIVFLNSDVFPETVDWLEKLAQQLKVHPDVGAIGGMLLFEDGSVQHQGMEFERLREFGDWFFPIHRGKGLRDAGDQRLRYCTSITGACMMMARALALKVGGFDEVYAIGDFEDSDVCLRLKALGYGCAVDPTVRLYHLERKSQIGSGVSWRLGLTLYNAWQHQRRWAAMIEHHQVTGWHDHASRQRVG